MKALINSAQFFTIYEVENETIALLIGKEGPCPKLLLVDFLHNPH
jgi:hypothetical protein